MSKMKLIEDCETETYEIELLEAEGDCLPRIGDIGKCSVQGIFRPNMSLNNIKFIMIFRRGIFCRKMIQVVNIKYKNKLLCSATL